MSERNAQIFSAIESYPRSIFSRHMQSSRQAYDLSTAENCRRSYVNTLFLSNCATVLVDEIPGIIQVASCWGPSTKRGGDEWAANVFIAPHSQRRRCDVRFFFLFWYYPLFLDGRLKYISLPTNEFVGSQQYRVIVFGDSESLAGSKWLNRCRLFVQL